MKNHYRNKLFIFDFVLRWCHGGGSGMAESYITAVVVQVQTFSLYKNRNYNYVTRILYYNLIQFASN